MMAETLNKKEERTFAKFWKFIHYLIKNINWISLVAIVITMASIFTTISLWKYSNNFGYALS